MWMFTNSFLTNKNRKRSSLNFKAFKKRDANHYSTYDIRMTRKSLSTVKGKMALFLAYLNSRSYETTERQVIFQVINLPGSKGREAKKVCHYGLMTKNTESYQNHSQDAGRGYKKSFERTEIDRRHTQITQKLIDCKRDWSEM